NACPIRMSYVLNATWFPIARNSPNAKVSGADNKLYIYRVNDMIDYLTHTMGKPDLIVNNPKQSDFIWKKGIIVVIGHGCSNARGHVTLWNGSICSDQCHLLN
ncbi:type VI secretion system amidase effector protein Tae4, partial [Salmonella enterica]|uniref:type VI secretion system amidase effector protein Tae4 n=1 Tax=Salmonella enterica TaxID=28901 RepID=UPI003F1B4FC1